jgi:hypothetical protein
MPATARLTTTHTNQNLKYTAPFLLILITILPKLLKLLDFNLSHITYLVYKYYFYIEKIKCKQEVVGRTDLLLPLDTTWTA